MVKQKIGVVFRAGELMGRKGYRRLVAEGAMGSSGQLPGAHDP